jgi:molybdopterin converting factor small subunit
MQISVRLYSVLRHREGQIVDRLVLELPTGSRLADILELLVIDTRLEVVLAINGEICTKNCLLNEGDIVSIIPSVAGG